MEGRNSGSIEVCFVSPKIHYYLASSEKEGAGGAEHQQYRIAKYLVDHNFEVSFLTERYNDGDRVKKEERINVYQYIPETVGLRNAPQKIISVLIGLHTSDADIYYVRSATLLTALTALYCTLFNKKYIFAAAIDKALTPKERNPNPVLRKLSNWAIGTADKVVVQTEHQQELCSQNHGLEPLVIPNGVSIPPKSDLVEQEKREYVLWVGRIDRDQKHPERYIQLAEKLPDVQFLMIGTPNQLQKKYYNTIQERANKLQNIEFLGFVPPEEIDQYYRRAFALVNTSDYEGFPNVFLEAWRYGTPVVSLYFSLGDEIENKGLGRVSGDESTLRNDVEEIVRDTATRTHLGENCRQHVKQYYSIETTAGKYASLFKSVANSNRSHN